MWYNWSGNWNLISNRATFVIWTINTCVSCNVRNWFKIMMIILEREVADAYFYDLSYIKQLEVVIIFAKDKENILVLFIFAYCTESWLSTY